MAKNGNLLVDALKESLQLSAADTRAIPAGHMPRANLRDDASPLGTVLRQPRSQRTIPERPESDPCIMKVCVSRAPRKEKSAQYIYPYKSLDRHSATYRGYPIDGIESLTTSKKWKVQLVNPACGNPMAPLPQFPQQEILIRGRDGYRGVPPRALSEKETLYNSGEAWLLGAERPKSEFFFTAGYTEGSAVKLQKPYTDSFYRSVVSGTPVPVKVVKSPHE